MDGSAVDFYPARNRLSSPLRFEIHPDDLFRINAEIEERGEEIARIYHSTPEDRGVPSQTDVNLAAWWPGIDWIDLLARGRRGRRPRLRDRDGAVDGGGARCRLSSGRAARLPDLRRKYPLSERFCSDCGMPLVYVGRGEEEPITEAHERARKVKPQYTRRRAGEGRATPRNLAEAQLIQGILLEEGIPSFERTQPRLRRPRLPGGRPARHPRPEAGAEAARELLSDLGGDPPAPPASALAEPPVRFLAKFVAVVIAAAALVWVLYQLAT